LKREEREKQRRKEYKHNEQEVQRRLSDVKARNEESTDSTERTDSTDDEESHKSTSTNETNENSESGSDISIDSLLPKILSLLNKNKKKHKILKSRIPKSQIQKAFKLEKFNQSEINNLSSIINHVRY